MAAAAASSGLRYDARVEPWTVASAPVNNCTPTAFGAVPMPVGYKSMPCSETSDATAAIESALRWCATSTVLLPPGEFRVDGTLTVAYSKQLHIPIGETVSETKRRTLTFFSIQLTADTIRPAAVQGRGWSGPTAPARTGRWWWSASKGC